jgi:hypothetical protein
MEYCWIAERGGINVGSVLITNGGDGIAKLRLLYLDRVRPRPRPRQNAGGRVHPLFQSQGATGRSRSGPTTSCTPPAAIYVKAGFRLVAEERHSMFGPELNGQTWVLDL